MADHDFFMDAALASAIKGGTFVSPNPVVGAVVVKDGSIIGRGWHKQYGGPHAEVFALQEAGEKARGATLYCTLEPCNHTGKTPPCTQAVIRAGIARVVLGARDPNPVAAGGVDALRAAGIDVVTGVGEQACREVNAPFFKFHATGLSFVTLKWAMTADGKIATASGDSKWISGEESRAFTHQMRAGHDAVLIGINTLLADGARLTARNVASTEPVHQPRRVILDSNARTPVDAPLFKESGAGPVVIVAKSSAPPDRVKALGDAGALVLRVESSERHVPVRQALSELAKIGVRSVFVEGGSSVHGAILDAKVADRVFIFIAPILIGGVDAKSATGGLGVAKISEGLRLRDFAVGNQGEDQFFSGNLSEWVWRA
jgi:diaminohydroxyphosphoribosylaminopyrimidine deaminase/5-amino-6-(5-phosphoribosylamino)uracil reductase